MSNKKGFKNVGAEAVSKFFSHDTLDTHITHNDITTQNTQTTQDEQVKQDTQLEQDSKKVRVQSRPRINMAFDEDLLAYVQIMARVDGLSVTQYCNNLVKNDMVTRSEDFIAAKKLFKIK